MNQNNIDKLNQYRPKLLVWQNDKTCHLSADEKVEIRDIIREEFNPGYTVDLFCGICVVGMLEYAFKAMDSWIEMQYHMKCAEKTLNPDPPLPSETITIELIREPFLYKKKKK